MPCPHVPEILRLYAEGRFPTEIGRIIGMHPTTVRYHLIRAKVFQPATYAETFDWTPDRLRELHELYPVIGAKKLGERFGCPYYIVTTRAAKEGLKSLNRSSLQGETKRSNNTSVRLDFFDQWSPEMAYVLGYIWADGSVAVDKKGHPRAVRFLATETDGAFLRQVADTMEFTGTFGIHPERSWVCKKTGRTYLSKPALKFVITSAHLARRLIDLHGLCPRKSFADPPYPGNVPDEFLSHFARGNLDGDGSVMARTGANRATVNWLGSHRFVSGLAEQIKRVAEVSAARLSDRGTLRVAVWSAKDDVLRLRDWLYDGATLWLPRKLEKFDAAVDLLMFVKARPPYRC